MPMSSELPDLSGKIAVVIGASRGLGQYFERALAHAGADLVIRQYNSERIISGVEAILPVFSFLYKPL